MAYKVYVARGQMKYCSEKCGHLGAIKRPAIEHGGEIYTLDNNGYYVTGKASKKLHRVVWEEANGPIPNGYIVHHRDGDKANNELSNLELIEWGAHTALHLNQRAESLPTKLCTACGKAIGRGYSGRRTCGGECRRIALSRAGVKGGYARAKSR